MTKREAYGSAHLAAIENSGLTTVAYARREGLSAKRLYQWRSRLRERLAPTAVAADVSRRFIALQVRDTEVRPIPSSGCTLTLAPGLRLDLPSVPALEWLSRLVTAMHPGVA